MKITFYAHASFRLETADLSVVTDPYTPGPAVSGFEPIGEPADVVLMSSTMDRFHSDPSHVTGDPVVIDALDPPQSEVARSLHLRCFPAMESATFDFKRDPNANAMSLFTLGGIRVLHMGDVGNSVPAAHLAALHGQVDVMFALTGAHATIALDDLDAAIAAIDPRIVIPMHYWHPRGRLDIEKVEAFLDRHQGEAITRVGGPSIEIEPRTLPAGREIVVLEPSR